MGCAVLIVGDVDFGRGGHFEVDPVDRGLAVAVGERMGARVSNSLQLASQRSGKFRAQGKTPRPWNTARRVLEDRRQEREAEWAREARLLWRPLGFLDKP